MNICFFNCSGDIFDWKKYYCFVYVLDDVNWSNKWISPIGTIANTHDNLNRIHHKIENVDTVECFHTINTL